MRSFHGEMSKRIKTCAAPRVSLPRLKERSKTRTCGHIMEAYRHPTFDMACERFDLTADLIDMPQSERDRVKPNETTVGGLAVNVI